MDAWSIFNIHIPLQDGHLVLQMKMYLDFQKKTLYHLHCWAEKSLVACEYPATEEHGDLLHAYRDLSRLLEFSPSLMGVRFCTNTVYTKDQNRLLRNYKRKLVTKMNPKILHSRQFDLLQSCCSTYIAHSRSLDDLSLKNLIDRNLL
jgi:hypothetical protein